MSLDLYISELLYELEEDFRKNLSYFDDVVFKYDEANIDQQIKNKIKDYILKNIITIKSVTQIYENKTSLVKDDYKIIDVKVSSQLNAKDREYIKGIKKSVYTNPDLLFFIYNGTNIIRVPIEVKSTKIDKISGSSIQQINSKDWVMFIKHDERKVLDITTGRYFNSINGKIHFPDRSPRPQVSFNHLKKWNEKYRKCNNGVLEFLVDESIDERIKILNDWQALLSNKWLHIIKISKKSNNEPWFNNNIRKYSLILLNEYDSMNEKQKEEFKKFIQANIEVNYNE